jgi:hypothetical protein
LSACPEVLNCEISYNPGVGVVAPRSVNVADARNATPRKTIASNGPRRPKRRQIACGNLVFVGPNFQPHHELFIFIGKVKTTTKPRLFQPQFVRRVFFSCLSHLNWLLLEAPI